MTVSSSKLRKGQWKYLPLPDWMDTIINNNVMVAQTLNSGKKIILITRKVNFQTAVRACASIDAKIILPVSSSENKEINEFLLKELGDTGKAWLRISDSNSEGSWYDTFDNSLIDTSWNLYGFTNWQSNEPNNKDGLEDYAAIYTAFWKKSHKSWNDVQGTDTLHIVCEFEKE